MKFRARALSEQNVLSDVVVDAVDEADARRQLRARGFFASEVRVAAAPGWSTILTAGRAERFDLLMFCQELLALLRAGLSIVEALEALIEHDGEAGSSGVLGTLLRSLREGQRLSSALAAQPQQFPPLFVGVVRAAEGTSDLPRSLARYIDYLQRLRAVRQKVVSAAVYPSILLGVGAAVTLFLTLFVVPRFAEVYEDSGRALPAMSQWLLLLGRFASTHTLPLLVAGLGLAVGAVLVSRRMLARHGVAGLLGRIPGIGARVRTYELSTIYLTLGMLCDGGIPLARGLETVTGLVSTPLGTALLASRKMVEEGVPLSGAFQANGLTTPISLRMLRVGERTGGMGEMLLQSASFYDGDISRWVDRFTRSFEPLLMAVIGIVIGVIVVLLYMPIFDLAGGL